MDSQARELLFLSRIPGVGPARLQGLLECFDNPGSILSAGVKDLSTVRGMNHRLASRIARAASGVTRERLWQWVDTQLELLSRAGARLITLREREYPANLRNTCDPPPCLFVRGSLVADDDRSVAVVGTRSMSPHGARIAEDIAGGLVRLGLTVISGLARGIDSVAHRSALAAGGRTIAVIGSGIDRVYPPENGLLAERVAGHGAVLSEYAMGERPLPFHFPRRNRIVSGMALATIIVESGPAGGAMITAARALDQGRAVFAVPTEADLQRESGTNLLIKQGRAQLLDTLADLVHELSARPGTSPGCPQAVDRLSSPDR